MSEEEKKAIKLLKDEIEKCKNLTTRNQPMSDIVYEIIKEKTAIKCVVNLVENQQREIEELKTKLEIEKIDNKYNQEERDEETIPRYKIREKIKELKKCKDISQVVGSIVILEELLEDNKNENKM